MVRVSIPWIDFDGLLTSAFEQIRLYSKADIAVSLRMLRALGDIAGTVEDPAYRLKLDELGRRIVSGCAERLTEEEVRPMRSPGCAGTVGLRLYRAAVEDGSLQSYSINSKFFA